MDSIAIVLVVAVAKNDVIGHRNALPWHIPGDLRRFRQITMGKPVVMGRKTYDSIGKPLPGRHNIVVTRNGRWHADGVTAVPSLADAFAVAARDVQEAGDGRIQEIMVIGGAGIFAAALSQAARIELTSVELEPEGDVFMPRLDPLVWRCVKREDVAAAGDVPGHAFLTLVRH